MSLGNNEKKIYLGIFEGKISQRVTKDTPNAKERVKKDGSSLYELYFDNVKGILTGISVKKGDYQGAEIKTWVLQLTDVGENYQLEINYDSAYAKSFLKSLLNPALDITAPITITPWFKKQDGKTKSAIYLSQYDNQIDWFFTKDNPNGLPELKPVRVKGKDTWDDEEQMKFFEEQVESKVRSKIGGYKKTEATTPAPGDNVEWEQAPDDDLPF